MEQLSFVFPIYQLLFAFCKQQWVNVSRGCAPFSPAGLSVSCSLLRWAVLHSWGPSLRGLWVFSELVIAWRVLGITVLPWSPSPLIWLFITHVFDLSEDKPCGQNLFRFVFLTLIHYTEAFWEDMKKTHGKLSLIFLRSFSSKCLEIGLLVQVITRARFNLFFPSKPEFCCSKKGIPWASVMNLPI